MWRCLLVPENIPYICGQTGGLTSAGHFITQLSLVCPLGISCYLLIFHPVILAVQIFYLQSKMSMHAINWICTVHSMWCLYIVYFSLCLEAYIMKSVYHFCVNLVFPVYIYCLCAHQILVESSYEICAYIKVILVELN